MQFPTGGKAHEPQGMIRCDSEADSTVWMKEDNDRCRIARSCASGAALVCVHIPGLFLLEEIA